MAGFVFVVVVGALADDVGASSDAAPPRPPPDSPLPAGASPSPGTTGGGAFTPLDAAAASAASVSPGGGLSGGGMGKPGYQRNVVDRSSVVGVGGVAEFGELGDVVEFVVAPRGGIAGATERSTGLLLLGGRPERRLTASGPSSARTLEGSDIGLGRILREPSREEEKKKLVFSFLGKKRFFSFSSKISDFYSIFWGVVSEIFFFFCC